MLCPSHVSSTCIAVKEKTPFCHHTYFIYEIFPHGVIREYPGAFMLDGVIVDRSFQCGDWRVFHCAEFCLVSFLGHTSASQVLAPMTPHGVGISRNGLTPELAMTEARASKELCLGQPKEEMDGKKNTKGGKKDPM